MCSEVSSSSGSIAKLLSSHSLILTGAVEDESAVIVRVEGVVNAGMSPSSSLIGTGATEEDDALIGGGFMGCMYSSSERLAVCPIGV